MQESGVIQVVGSCEVQQVVRCNFLLRHNLIKACMCVLQAVIKAIFVNSSSSSTCCYKCLCVESIFVCEFAVGRLCSADYESHSHSQVNILFLYLCII